MHIAPISAEDQGSLALLCARVSVPVSFHQTRQPRENASASDPLVVDATGQNSWDDENRRGRIVRARFHCEGSTK